MEPSAPSPSHAGFEETPWSTVLLARSDSPTRRAALERLCRAYWPPVYAFVRRRGFSPEDAQDLTQGFFFSILTENFFDRAEPEKGRFRGYLAGALRWYLNDHRDRLAAWKRGGRTTLVPLDAFLAAERQLGAAANSSAGSDSGSGSADGTDPAREFDRRWAQTLLESALARLAQEQTTAGRSRHFSALQGFLVDPPAKGDYERVAATLGLTRTHVAVLVHRLHQRLGEILQLHVSATVANPADVRDELQQLLRTLSG